MPSETKPFNVYCAGKIAKRDWRHDLFPALRLVEMDHEGVATYPSGSLTCSPFRYGGPFFMGCDHGCYHGPGEHGLGVQNWIACGHLASCGPSPFGPRMVIEMCEGWIRNSDAVFVWLDQSDAFGTFAEIGMARAMGKPIWLYYPKRWEEAASEAWFPVECATAGGCTNTAAGAWAAFASEFPWYVEHKKRHRWGQERAQAYLTAAGSKSIPRAFSKGFVYLLQSGCDFKIGKASVLDRRVKQVRVALPNPVAVVHALEASHMDAAELYFHAAFQDLRKNGEWFDLKDRHIDWFRSFRTWDSRSILT